MLKFNVESNSTVLVPVTLSSKPPPASSLAPLHSARGCEAPTAVLVVPIRQKWGTLARASIIPTAASAAKATPPYSLALTVPVSYLQMEPQEWFPPISRRGFTHRLRCTYLLQLFPPNFVLLGSMAYLNLTLNPELQVDRAPGMPLSLSLLTAYPSSDFFPFLPSYITLT